MPRVVAARRKLVETSKTYASLVSLAVAVAASGDFEAADDLYVAALEAHRDVSPFPYAWVAFQRGLMWAEQASTCIFRRLRALNALRKAP